VFIDQNEKDRYIQKVWGKVQSKYLQVYPFLTESEFRDLFGEEVIKVIDKLDCPSEACGRCDLEIDCPYYSKMLDRCGIDPYKPVHCRLWHCYDCGPEHIIKDVRELTGVFSDQLGPEVQAMQIKCALERAHISREEAVKRFKQLIEEFRSEGTF
jgi:Fe-S-cluster containining protein